MRWDFVLWLFIVSVALGLPNKEPSRPRTSCIRMTPEKEQQIDAIVEKLSDFVNTLQLEHPHFDIRLIKLAIEQHTAEEVEEKETMLQLSVNDCQVTDDELDEIDHHTEKAKQREAETQRNAGNAKNFNVMFLDLPENGQKLLEAMDNKEKGPRLVYVAKDKGQLDYLFLTKNK